MSTILIGIKLFYNAPENKFFRSLASVLSLKNLRYRGSSKTYNIENWGKGVDLSYDFLPRLSAKIMHKLCHYIEYFHYIQETHVMQFRYFLKNVV